MIENRAAGIMPTLNLGSNGTGNGNGNGAGAAVPMSPSFEAPKHEFGILAGHGPQQHDFSGLGQSLGFAVDGKAALTAKNRELGGGMSCAAAGMGAVGKDNRRTSTVVRSHRKFRRAGSLDGRPSSPLCRLNLAASNRGSSASPDRTTRRPGPYDRPNLSRAKSTPHSPGHSRRSHHSPSRATPEPLPRHSHTPPPPPMSLPATVNVSASWPDHMAQRSKEPEARGSPSPSPSPAAQAAPSTQVNYFGFGGEYS